MTTSQTSHYHAGYNMPGYLPESEPVAFDLWEDAARWTGIADEFRAAVADHAARANVRPTIFCERIGARAFATSTERGAWCHACEFEHAGAVPERVTV